MSRAWSPQIGPGATSSTATGRRPQGPADCAFDYGQGISVAPGERAQFVCAGDTAFGPDSILPYGESISAGALRCDSTEAGITCRDLRTAHGFSISREAYQLF